MILDKISDPEMLLTKHPVRSLSEVDYKTIKKKMSTVQTSLKREAYFFQKEQQETFVQNMRDLRNIRGKDLNK